MPCKYDETDDLYPQVFGLFCSPISTVPTLIESSIGPHSGGV
jgi:hypothetical protein